MFKFEESIYAGWSGSLVTWLSSDKIKIDFTQNTAFMQSYSQNEMAVFHTFSPVWSMEFIRSIFIQLWQQNMTNAMWMHAPLNKLPVDWKFTRTKTSSTRQPTHLGIKMYIGIRELSDFRKWRYKYHQHSLWKTPLYHSFHNLPLFNLPTFMQALSRW